MVKLIGIGIGIPTPADYPSGVLCKHTVESVESIYAVEMAKELTVMGRRYHKTPKWKVFERARLRFEFAGAVALAKHLDAMEIGGE